MLTDEAILNTITNPKHYLAALGLAGVGLGATAGVYDYKRSQQRDPMSKGGEAAQMGLSALLWTGIIGVPAYGISRLAGKIPNKGDKVKKVSSVVSSWGKRLFKGVEEIGPEGKTVHKLFSPMDKKALKIGGIATLAVLGGSYLMGKRPEEYERDDQAEPIGSGVRQRMNMMNAGGDLVMGLHNGRHG